MASDPNNKGWLSVQGNTSKKSRRTDDDGTPLLDEIILLIFIGFLDIADLVRCAATCKRWRRLVSSNATFICEASQRLRHYGKFLPSLALGFFQQCNATALRFIPRASSPRRFVTLRGPVPPLRKLVDDGLLDSSRIVASRNGFIVIELHRGKHSRALKLCVWNPMSGQVHVLPPLRGKDGLGCYACTVVTAADCQNRNNNNNNNNNAQLLPPSSSHYRLLLVYSRFHFTAFRSYSSEDGRWTPEGKVTGPQLGKKQMRLMRNGVVAYGGKVAYWCTSDVVFGLHLDTLEATMACLPASGRDGYMMETEDTLLGMTPKGRLCAIQLTMRLCLTQQFKWDPTIGLRVMIYNCNGDIEQGMPQMTTSMWKTKFNRQVGRSFQADPFPIEAKLQWFCEKSGVVFFTASYQYPSSTEVYALSLGSGRVLKVAQSNKPRDDMLNNIYGYETDYAAYLASLAGPEDKENV